MTIHWSSYDTFIGRVHANSVHTIPSAIEKAVVSNYLVNSRDSFTTITPKLSAAAKIPEFAHPLATIDKALEKVNVYIDARPFMDYNQYTGVVQTKSPHDFHILQQRAALEYHWRMQGIYSLRDISLVPVSAMASWISENITKRFALDATEQYRLTIFSAFYYYSLFEDDKEKSETQFTRMVAGMSRATKIDASEYFNYLDGQDYIRNISDFCERVGDFVGSVRLKDLNPAVLYTTLGGSWYGANGKEIIAISLEHPPTFMTMIYAGATEKLFRRSLLNKLVERLPVKNQVPDYVRQIQQLTQNLILNSQPSM